MRAQVWNLISEEYIYIELNCFEFLPLSQISRMKPKNRRCKGKRLSLNSPDRSATDSATPTEIYSSHGFHISNIGMQLKHRRLDAKTPDLKTKGGGTSCRSHTWDKSNLRDSQANNFGFKWKHADLGGSNGGLDVNRGQRRRSNTHRLI